jgi:hypothetical protein
MGEAASVQGHTIPDFFENGQSVPFDYTLGESLCYS